MELSYDHILCGRLTVSNDFYQQIKDKQLWDPQLCRVVLLMGTDKSKDFARDTRGLVRYRGRICVPDDDELKRLILDEGHKSNLSIHPGMTKMYHDLKQLFWWHGMKKNIVDYVASCLTCQKAKTEHQRPPGLLHTLELPEWK